MKRQIFQEQKLNKKANTKIAWNKKKIARKQSSEKPRAVSIQQARKQRLKEKFSIFDGKLMITDLKNAYIGMTVDICTTCLSSLFRKGISEWQRQTCCSLLCSQKNVKYRNSTFRKH